MNDPLENLKPLHNPEAISWWPPAPGWWVLLAIAALAAALFSWFRYQRRLQRHALRELEQLQAQNLTASQMANQVNQLLKRYALVCYPRAEVAGLSGKNWLRFLKKSSDDHMFLRAGKLLLDTPYQRKAKRGDERALFDFAADWIKRNQSGVSR
jgi:HAMP domain-containing protein